MGKKQIHIMLMFLSDVKTRDGKVSRADYGELGTTYTTNESAVLYLLKQGCNNRKIECISKIFAFISNKVWKESVDAEDVPLGTDGRKMTHYAYFKWRLSQPEYEGRTEGCLDESSIVHYAEDAPVTGIMELCVELAQKIRAYVQYCADAYPDCQVILHADTSGGFRHASMMLISVMRLLQYEDITIGHILYSNYVRNSTSKVEEISEIYHMLDLVSGAEEFSRFGSIQAMKAYFENRECSPELKQLLDTMQKFAEEIKLCHRSAFVQTIGQLKNALEKFSQTKEKSPISAESREERLNDKLMLQLENRIQRDYAPLWEIEHNPLKAVRWCLDHDYLQQALTLFNEMLPGYLIRDCHLLVLSPQVEEAAKKSYAHHRKMEPDFSYFLLNYQLAKNRMEDKDIKRFRDKLFAFLTERMLLKRIRHQDITAKQAAKEIVHWLGQADSALSLENQHHLEQTLEQYAPGRKSEDNRKLKELADQVIAYPLLGLLARGEVTSSLHREEWVFILLTYSRLRRERNTENHAKETASQFDSSTELKKYFLDALDRLESIISGAEAA